MHHLPEKREKPKIGTYLGVVGGKLTPGGGGNFSVFKTSICKEYTTRVSKHY